MLRHTLLIALVLSAISCTRTRNTSVHPSTSTALANTDVGSILLVLGAVAMGAIAVTLVKGEADRGTE
jgi:hypothetical protein